MPITELLLTGVELLALGMGIVFGFLTVLVFTLRGMSWLAGRIARQPTVPAAGTVQAVPLPQQTDDTELVAVIAAAVARYRARPGR